MKKKALFCCAAILALLLACAGFAEETGETAMNYRTEEILCRNGADSIYGTVPLRWSEDAAQIIPDCEFHVISGGGHEFFGRPFEEAVTCILAYLENRTENEAKEVQPQMKMRIGDTLVEAAWEDNESVAALKELVQDGLTIQMSMYGGFEQVGSIGRRLPSSDVQTHTTSGDIVLYSGDQLVVFYGSNSWAYTRLGHITDKTPEEMRDLLSNGDVTITLSME